MNLFQGITFKKLIFKVREKTHWCEDQKKGMNYINQIVVYMLWSL